MNECEPLGAKIDRLIAALQARTDAEHARAQSDAALAEAINTQGAAINALAESLAACTSEPVQEEPSAPSQKPDVPRYMDGTPIGR